MFWQPSSGRGVQPSPASTRKKYRAPAKTGARFVFFETDSGGLVAIALFSYFAGVKHTKVTKQAIVV
jgi:hypothetical protein